MPRKRKGKHRKCLICDNQIYYTYRNKKQKYCSIKCKSTGLLADLVGKKFGRLLVIENNGVDPVTRNRRWGCLCDCGNKKTLITSRLTREREPTKSCGCMGVERRFKKGQNTGEDNHRWSGGRYMGTHGYVWVIAKNHPCVTNRGTIREHRLVMEKKIGRYLKPKESVHHINEIKHDNRPENLMLFSSESDHQKYHRWLERNDLKPGGEFTDTYISEECPVQASYF